MSQPAPPPVKRLVRDGHDQLLGGVCSGLAHYLGADVTLVRLLTVVAALFSLGTVAIAYVAAWVLVPRS